MHINSLVDYISESGTIAGRCAARYMTTERRLIEVNAGKDFLFLAPQLINLDSLYGDAILFFRVRENHKDAIVRVLVDGQEVLVEQFPYLRPSETRRLSINFGTSLTAESKVNVHLSNE